MELLLGAVELMKITAPPSEPGFTVTVPFGIEQVGGTTGLAVPLYATEQLRVTVPTKPDRLITEIGSRLKFDVVPAANDSVLVDTCRL